ncbi:hypothetical protein BASA60_002097 [Batrachochytrium salamandrivorans]|nr:hypothetical protein BASA60_002097 [Batrachochytrium salamandrivorans]
MALLYKKDHLGAAHTYAVLVGVLVAVGILPWKRLIRGSFNNVVLRSLNSIPLVTIPFWPYLSLSDLVFIAIYLALTVLFGITDISVLNDTDVPRFGFMALSNLAVLTLLPQRNSLLSAFFGISRERCLLFHSILGTVTILLSLLHGSLYLYEWSYYDFLIESINSRAMITYGLASGGVMSLVLLTSAVTPIRRLSFELFYWIHILSYPAMLALLFLHTSHSVEFFCPGAILYGVDRLLRIVRALRPAKIIESVAVDDLLIRLKFEQPTFLGSFGKARAGQYFFVQFPAISLFEWHPFSMISSEDDFIVDDRKADNGSKTSFELVDTNKESLSNDSRSSYQHGLISFIRHRQSKSQQYELAIRREGHFTRKLHEHIGNGKSLSVLVDGPYGRSFDGVMDRDTILLVAGGVGITPLISILQTIMSRNQNSAHDTPRIHVRLIWVVRDSDNFNWFEKELSEATANGIKIHLFATCACEDSTEKTSHLPVSVEFSRPSIIDIMRDMVGDRKSGNVSVAVCGTQSLVTTVKHSARLASTSCGMFIVFSETFSL